MNAYLLSIIGTILISAFITAIAPEGKTSVVVKAVTRLACILVIIAPILRFLQTKDSTKNAENTQGILSETVIETDEDFIQYYQEKRIRATEVALQEELYGEFSVSCSVTLGWEAEEEDIRITRIYVRLQDQIAEEEKGRMSDYLAKNYCSEVLIE